MIISYITTPKNIVGVKWPSMTHTYKLLGVLTRHLRYADTDGCDGLDLGGGLADV